MHTMNNNTNETLLATICQKLDHLFSVPYAIELLELLQLNPAWLIDARRTCYLPDAVAAYYWATFDPQESLDAALERCIIAQLHQKAMQACIEEENCIRHLGKLWQCLSFSELQQLVWRCRDKNGIVRCYLHRYGQRLGDPFCLRIDTNGTTPQIKLQEGRHGNEYTLNWDENTEYLHLCRWMQENILRVTEDFGSYIPEDIWIEYIGFAEG